MSLAESNKHKIVFRPPYSSEYNPIEKFLTWLKRKLRKELSYFSTITHRARPREVIYN
ncbi:MAG: transposase [Clostridiales bacterium]|nr:transposase [Clostridiales bacterium]